MDREKGTPKAYREGVKRRREVCGLVQVQGVSMSREARTRQADRQCHCEKEESFRNSPVYDSSMEFCRKTSPKKFTGSNPFESQMGLVMLVTKRDRSESTSQGRVMCEHY